MDKMLEKIYGMSHQEMEKCAEHLMLGGGTRGGPVLDHGKGVRVWDVDGKEYSLSLQPDMKTEMKTRTATAASCGSEILFLFI